MRLNQFLEKLAMTPRTWSVDEYTGVIRMEDLSTQFLQCPISMVAQDIGVTEIYGSEYAVGLGPVIGLSEKTTQRIMDAADNPYVYPTLRRRLLRACGLTRMGLR